MGYSISTVAKSKQAKQQMLSFLQDNFREYHEVVGVGDMSHSEKPSGDLSYCNGKLKIGVDYGFMTGAERKYNYALCYWMALRIGRRTSVIYKTRVYPIAHLNYDDSEQMPVIPNYFDLPESFISCPRVDKHGWYFTEHDQQQVDEWKDSYEAQNPKEDFNPFAIAAYEKVEAELHRLSDLWDSL